MKINRKGLSSQILIAAMAGSVLMFMLQAARAQSNDQALQNMQSNNSSNAALAQASGANQTYQSSNTGQVLQIGMPQKSLGRRLWENTSLSYYQQFLGPTAAGGGNTYNVFQEGLDTPNSGFAPMQSFHAVNLRHQINTDWAVGATLSAANGYTKEVNNKDRSGGTFTNRPDSEFFNARAYVSLPSLRFAAGTLFSTLSYEFPTSEISKDDEMRFGWVASNSFAFNLPNLHWNVGLMSQIYRIYYNNNVKAAPFVGGRPTALQTMIVSGGPYANYRFNDKWQVGSVITMDWDQRGAQTGSRDFNNNLSHRGRLSLTYFPQQIKYLQSVGLFSQALLKFRPETTAFGADFAVRF
ncbi:hypothetical protein [Peredibacter starrii]|uniref:MetA-pathway of phenol degradation n=1 Tax=Peredibacter starrii TaxID=28202 RepID=A0AAX4HK66_9BACT|nr:hypothetical protein [Peredibacter starrii]WPU63625.1 hypothetical protein SOO65_13095 [Peredibacter starrii]